MQCILREPCELRLTNAHDRRVVAALEINIRRIMHALVHHDVEAIALADRGDGPVRAIGEKLIEFVLGGERAALAEPSLEIFSFETVRCRQDSEYVTFACA